MWPRAYAGKSIVPGCHLKLMLPQNDPYQIQRRNPGNRGTVDPSGSDTGSPATGAASCATKVAASDRILSNSSRAASSGRRRLSEDQPRSNALTYSGSKSTLG